MSPLEKAARALAVEYYAAGAATEEDKIAASEQWTGFLSLARAVLLAVRDSDVALAADKVEEDCIGFVVDLSMVTTFRAMIDAILEGE